MSARPLTVRLAAAIEDFGRSLDVRRVRRTRREALRRRAERLMASAIAGRDLAALREALAAEGLAVDMAKGIAAQALIMARADADAQSRFFAWKLLSERLPDAVKQLRAVGADAPAKPSGPPPPALPHRKDIDG